MKQRQHNSSYLQGNFHHQHQKTDDSTAVNPRMCFSYFLWPIKELYSYLQLNSLRVSTLNNISGLI